MAYTLNQGAWQGGTDQGASQNNNKSYTSTQPGNWSDNNTWGGGGHPVSGDTAIIGHAVAVDVNSVVGDGGTAGTNCLTINAGGTLTINAGITLTVQRDAYLNGGATVMQAGSTWAFDLVDGYKLSWNGTSGNTITINGTSVYRCTFQGNGSYTYYWEPAASTSIVGINANYCDFTRMGSASQIGFDVYGPATAQTIYFNHCLWTTPGRMDFSNTYHANAATTFKIENCDFRSCVNSGHLWVIGENSGGQTADANTRWFKQCTFANNSGVCLLLREAGIANPWLIQNCVFEDTLLAIQCNAVSDSNILHQTVYINDQEIDIMSEDPITIKNCIAHINNGKHVFEDGGTTGDVICQENISFAEDVYYQNHYDMAGSGSNFNWNITKCICVGDTAVVARGSSYQKTLVVERLTHICKDKADDTFAIETVDVGASSIVNLRSIISYSVTTDIDIADNDIDTTADKVDYTDYHCVWDRSLTGRYYQIVISGKSVGDAGFGGSDIRADPSFNNVNATIQTWDTSLGGAGTVANAWAELLKLNGFARDGSADVYNSSYSVANALAYFRNAFTPTNISLKGAGYGGEDIGAMDIASGMSTTTWFFY